ncbi:MAG: SDR family oxidoreductase [Flavobacteriales bacterium]
MSSSPGAEISFPVNEEMIKAFVHFSGDRSSLHTDHAYGQRSRYNSTVIHGMLPVVLLPLVLHRHFPSGHILIRRAHARFIRPITPGSRTTIRSTVEVDENQNIQAFFTVFTGDEGSPATKGSLVLEKTASSNAFVTRGEPNSVIPGKLTEQQLHFEDLVKGQTCELPFIWDGEQMRAYVDLLKMAGREYPAQAHAEVLSRCNAEMFAQLAALSTLVGMAMPGRSATFQEFTLESNIINQDGPLSGQLHSMLTHLSPPTNTITQQVEFHLGKTVSAQGKVSVRVADAPFRSLSMEELSEKSRSGGLQGKVVLITGSSRGLGATTAKVFTLHGARVVINYRSSEEQALKLVEEIQTFGGEAVAIRADVTSEQDVDRMVKEVIALWGTVDVLVNNAAGNFHPASFRETPWSKVQEDLDVIVKGAYLVSQAVIPEFLRKGSGNIINVSSIAAETPPPGQVKYVVAKAALNGLSRSLAVEFADQNIRVNMVVPSFMKTDFTSGFDRVAMGKLKAISPMKRLAEPHEIAESILFLASEKSGYITGQKIMVTGGLPPFH